MGVVYSDRRLEIRFLVGQLSGTDLSYTFMNIESTSDCVWMSFINPFPLIRHVDDLILNIGVPRRGSEMITSEHSSLDSILFWRRVCNPHQKSREWKTSSNPSQFNKANSSRRSILSLLLIRCSRITSIDHQECWLFARKLHQHVHRISTEIQCYLIYNFYGTIRIHINIQLLAYHRKNHHTS